MCFCSHFLISLSLSRFCISLNFCTDKRVCDVMSDDQWFATAIIHCVLLSNSNEITWFRIAPLVELHWIASSSSSSTYETITPTNKKTNLNLKNKQQQQQQPRQKTVAKKISISFHIDTLLTQHMAAFVLVSLFCDCSSMLQITNNIMAYTANKVCRKWWYRQCQSYSQIARAWVRVAAKSKSKSKKQSQKKEPTTNEWLNITINVVADIVISWTNRKWYSLAMILWIKLGATRSIALFVRFTLFFFFHLFFFSFWFGFFFHFTFHHSHDNKFAGKCYVLKRHFVCNIKSNVS